MQLEVSRNKQIIGQSVNHAHQKTKYIKF